MVSHDKLIQLVEHSNELRQFADRDDRIGAAARVFLADLEGETVDNEDLAALGTGMVDRDQLQDIRSAPHFGGKRPTGQDVHQAAELLLDEFE